MYKKLPKTLFKHKHTKGWEIPGYSYEGVLFFTSLKKAREYTRTDGPIHGIDASDTLAVDEFPSAALPALLKENGYLEKDPGGTPKVVIFNLNNDSKYDAIYTGQELLNLLEGKSANCFASDYDPASFSGLGSLYNYQPGLTNILDGHRKVDFDQSIINEIVLWKVNRYVSASGESNWLSLLNNFKDDQAFQEEKLRQFLRTVVSDDIRGIRLAMASTFLRFRNPDVYQIIDERT